MQKAPEESIVLNPKDADICLGRGNAVNFRKGNKEFRMLARQKATAYGVASANDKATKDDIAESILAEIKDRGGRFLRSVSVRGENGEVSAAWEIVDHETSLAKVKQTLRDSIVAIRKEAADHTSSSSATEVPLNSAFAHVGRPPSAIGRDVGHGSPHRPHLNQLLQRLHGYRAMSYNPNDPRINRPSHPQISPNLQTSDAHARPYASSAAQLLAGIESRVAAQPSAMSYRNVPETAHRLPSAASSSAQQHQRSDMVLLAQYQRIQEESLLRRRYLLSQLSDEALRQFIASEQTSGLTANQNLTSGFREQQASGQAESGLLPTIIAETVSAADTNLASQEYTGSTGDTAPERTVEQEEGRTASESDRRVKPPPKKRHRLYEPEDKCE